MLRLPLLALTLILLAVPGAQLAHADGAAPTGASVTIAPSNGGAARTLDLATLTDRFDVHGVTYTLRAADGTTSRTTVADGISLTALLAAAGLDADAFTYIEVPHADDASTFVLRDDLGGDDEGPPVVWADAGGVHLLRPSSGGGDANAADLVTLADGPIALSLKTGDPLVPRAQVSTLRAKPGERIDFGASLAVGRLGKGMDFEWYFDGTGTTRGANVSHVFPRPGTYLVLLYVVRGSGETVGYTDKVRVHVVRPHERRSDDAHRSNDAQGGGTGSGDGTGAGTGSGTGGTGSTSPSYVAPAASPTPAPAPAPAPSRAPAPPPRPRGELVSGTLVASASTAATPAGGAQAARAAVHEATSDGPLHVPVGVWVAIGLALLLALGWVLESRHTLPFWQP